MIYEIKNPVLEKYSVKFAGLISIPHKSKLSDQLFLSKWGSKIIRPVIDAKNVDSVNALSSTVGLSEDSFLIYCEKINEFIKELKGGFSELVFIDVRFGSNFEEDVVVNQSNAPDSSYIKPVIKNLEFSRTKWAENIQSDLRLIDKITNEEKGVNAFQLLISTKLFESDVESALRIFEEAVIFSHLSVTGQI